MPTPIRGIKGKLQVGASGAEVEVKFVGKVEAESEKDMEKIGPFFNDGGKKYTVVTGKGMKFKVEAVIPDGGDAGQDDIIDAYEADLDIRLVFTTARGKIVTIPAATFAKLKFTTDAKETHRLEAEGEDNGGYTITQDAAP